MSEISRNRTWILGLALVASLAMAAWLAMGSARADSCGGIAASPPCFEEVDDILGGNTELLANDDLFVHGWLQVNSTSASVQDWTLFTEDEMIPAIPASDPAKTANNCASPDPKNPNVTPTSAAIGRLFWGDNDVVITVVPASLCHGRPILTMTDPDPSSPPPWTTAINGLGPPTVYFVKLADFDADGYQDVLLFTATEAQIFTAKCTGDPDADCTGGFADGLKLVGGGFQILPGGTATKAPPAVGDFNADGILDLAWGRNSIIDGRPGPKADDLIFASVCPAAGASVFGQSNLCKRAFQIVRPSGAQPFPIPTTEYLAMTAGNFTGATDPTTGREFDQLLFTVIPDPKSLDVMAVKSLDQKLVPPEEPRSVLELTGLKPDDQNKLRAFLASGRLDWSGSRDQAVIATTKDASCCRQGIISVLSFDDNLNLVASTEHRLQAGTSQKTRIFGLAIGRFDPADKSEGETDFDQQIAVLVDRAKKGSSNLKTWVYLYDVNTDPMDLDPDQGFLSLTLNQDLKLVPETRYFNNAFYQFDTLVAGDLQGRSQLLGSPQKLVFSQIQPDIILGVPPMHVYVDGAGESARVVNLSVYPSTLNAQFDMETSSNSDTSRAATTGYSASAKVTRSGKFSYGVPTSNVTGKIKASVGATWSSSVENATGSYVSKGYGLSTGTGFSDLVSYTDQDVNIYSYPIIGETSCPAGTSPETTNAPELCCPKDMVNANNVCTVSDLNDLDPPNQLFVQFTGPDNIDQITLGDPINSEWYQPLHEPGNLFSYLPNMDLVVKFGPQDLASPTQDPLLIELASAQSWSPQQNPNPSSQLLSWEAGSSEDRKVETSSSVTGDVSLSLSVKAGFSPVSVESKAKFDFSAATSKDTVNTASQSTESSAGVTINQNVSGEDLFAPSWSYLVNSQIYSLSLSTGQIQDLTAGASEDITGQGFLLVAHTANMLGNTAGSRWVPTFTKNFDLALNHPIRWTHVNAAQEVKFNCPMGYRNNANGTCSSGPKTCNEEGQMPAPPGTPDDLAGCSAPFYTIKGFFIREQGDDPPPQSPQEMLPGPTIVQATRNDVLTLETRLYNYSLLPIPGAGSPNAATVKAQFYAQPLDGCGNFAAGPDGETFAPALKIGDPVSWTGGIDAFCGGPIVNQDPCKQGTDTPVNWILLSTTWDTGELGSLSTPACVAGQPPINGAYWKFWVAAWVEDADGNLQPEFPGHGLASAPDNEVTSPASIDIGTSELYSNNFGYYNQIFFLTEPTAPAPSLANGNPEASLSIVGIDVSGAPIIKHEPLVVEVAYHAEGGDMQFVVLTMTEGNPDDGGRQLDHDVIPFVAADGEIQATFRYEPRACGPQSLLFDAKARDVGPNDRQSLLLEVTADPLAETRRLMAGLERLGLPRGTHRSLMAKLQAAERAFARGQEATGLNRLNAYANAVGAQRGKKIPAEAADRLLSAVAEIEECLMFGSG